jgi:hypothetical protein
MSTLQILTPQKEWVEVEEYVIQKVLAVFFIKGFLSEYCFTIEILPNC